MLSLWSLLPSIKLVSSYKTFFVGKFLVAGRLDCHRRPGLTRLTWFLNALSFGKHRNRNRNTKSITTDGVLLLWLLSTKTIDLGGKNIFYG